MPQLVSEENWFFRLSRYGGQLLDVVRSGRLRIEPVVRRNEILALIEGGLRDFSISRSAARARGWGIPVPGDPGQVIYVWWDALGNYVTSLGYGTGGQDLAAWWAGSGRRVHLVGKGVIRFHAVYWPAMLLSAGLALPTDIFVHDYLTIEGRKISKSSGVTADPAELVAQFGTDAVRWWLLREVPRVGDADFTVDRLVDRANSDLAGGLGNLVHRTVTMIHRYRRGVVPGTSRATRPALPVLPVRPTSQTTALEQVCAAVPAAVDAALEAFDFRRATSAVWSIVEEANRAIDVTRPWQLAKAEQGGDQQAAEQLDAVLAGLHHACVTLATVLVPFLPGAAELIKIRCTPIGGTLPASTVLFERIEG